MWQQQQELLPPASSATSDEFGDAVALSGDTAVVGAPTPEATGAAFVFTRSGILWSPQQELHGEPVANAMFGAAVALSGDTALIGAPDEPEGAAYVFARSGGAWTVADVLADPGQGAFDHFGTSVALDGDTALVGAVGVHAGAAYVYARSGDNWILQQALDDGVPADAGVNDELGTSVALSGDTAVVGAPTGPTGGAAYVFMRSGTTWTQAQQLTAADGAPGDAFGRSVAFDGETVVVGSSSMTASPGAAYVFTLAGTTWTQTQEITDPMITNFGYRVALSGGTVVVGGDPDQGSSAFVDAFAPSAGASRSRIGWRRTTRRRATTSAPRSPWKGRRCCAARRPPRR